MPAPAVVTSKHDRGLVLLHTLDGSLFSANQTGACVWRGLQAGLPLEVITDELSRDYGIPCSVAKQHVEQFLLALERHRLIATGAP